MVTIGNLSIEELLFYSTNGEIPKNIQESLKKVAQLYSEINDANGIFSNLETEHKEKIEEQNRIRKNIEAVGNNSAQGKEYIKTLVSLE